MDFILSDSDSDIEFLDLAIANKSNIEIKKTKSKSISNPQRRNYTRNKPNFRVRSEKEFFNTYRNGKSFTLKNLC